MDCLLEQVVVCFFLGFGEGDDDCNDRFLFLEIDSTSGVVVGFTKERILNIFRRGCRVRVGTPVVPAVDGLLLFSDGKHTS